MILSRLREGPATVTDMAATVGLKQLAWGRLASSRGHDSGGSRGWEDAELAEQSGDVHDDAALDEDAVAVAVDGPGLDGGGASSRRDTHELALVRARPRGEAHDPVALYEGVVKRPAEVREAANIMLRTPPRPARPGSWPGSGFSSTKSSATISTRAPSRSWALITSSMKRCKSARKSCWTAVVVMLVPFKEGFNVEGLT